MIRLKLLPILLLLFVALAWSPTGQAYAGGPENLVLVVNSESQSSKLLANHYISLRGIPECNVIYLDGIPKREIITVRDLNAKVLTKINDAMKERQLKNIDYIVYSSDFPAVVNIQSHQKILMAQAKEQGQPLIGNAKRLFHPFASLNSVTYFADAVMNDEPGYMLLDSNYYYRNTTKTALSKPFVNQDQIDFEYAVKMVKDAKYAEAIEAFLALGREHPNQIAVSYWLARAHAHDGQYDKAAGWLERSVSQGWQYRSYTENDPAFAEALEENDAFNAVCQRIPQLPFKHMATHGFKRGFAWSQNGSVNGKADQGRRYYLSTILAVTRNHGITEQQALDSLKRNAVADGTMPQGAYYFTETNDVRTRTRKINFGDAIEILQSLGYETQVIKQSMPAGKTGIMGVTMGTARFDWPSGKNEFLPGAIGDNLTSFGGKMNAAAQTKCTEFIAAGAAGASGTVIEPYAIQAKFPHPMLHAHYARGCTLAEAFYQSVLGPFQLLIVGDALCQPFARAPKFTVEGLELNQMISGKVEAKLDFSQTPVPIKYLELYIDGKLIRQRPFSDRIAFDSTMLSDGFHELRVIAIADNLLLTPGRVVLPIFIDNNDHRVELTAESNQFDVRDTIVLNINSNFGEAVEIKHNFRTVGKLNGKSGTVNVNASTLGRGPVKLTAVASNETGQVVSSVPLSLEILGKISNEKANTEPVKKPK